MTIMEAIHRIDSVKPNRYSQQEKIQWLSILDGTVKAEIIDTHEGAGASDFKGYTEKTDLNTPLLVPAPYDDIYLFGLESQIDYWNGEIKKYNNSIAMYNNAYSEFAKYYNRTHLPLGKKFKFFGLHKTPEYQAATAVAKVTIEED
jgi:hypothetical protein